jgi:hypothetical protein
MMNPTASRIVMAAKAATRGTLNRKQALRVAGGSSVRFLTLPPGSVRSYPFRDHNVFDGNLSEHNDDGVLDYDSRPKMQTSMPPRVRRFGTSSLDAPEDNGTWSSALRHFPGRTSFDEDYDEWSLHDPPASATSNDLGQVCDYDPTIQSILHNSTLGDNMAEYASPFENTSVEDDDVELEEDSRFFYGDQDAMIFEYDDVSLDY